MTNSLLLLLLLKSVVDNCLEYVTQNVYQMLANSTLPDELKQADVSPIYNYRDSTLKTNFRPLSALLAISKIFERFISKKICLFVYRILYKFVYTIREKLSAEHFLFRLTEICGKTLADGKIMGIVLMDRTKTYDCISHDLEIAKLAAYGSGQSSLLLIHIYLSNRK